MEPTSSISGTVEEELRGVIDSSSPTATLDIDWSDWSAVISEDLPDSMEFHEDGLCPEFHKNVWTWYYQFENDANVIVITLYGVQPENVSADCTSISSPTLSGLWWSPVDNVEVSSNGDNAVVKIWPPKHFPVLIKGGENIDPLSATYLGMMSLMSFKNMKWFKTWMHFAAEKGEQNAQQLLGAWLLQVGKEDEGKHWLARCVLEHDDDKAKIVLAEALFSGKGEISNPPFAEHILCGLCKKGNADAHLLLAKLVLKDAPGVPYDMYRGLELMKIAAEKYHIREAAETLKFFEENNMWSATDVVITAGALAVIGFGIYKLYKRFRK